MSDETRLQVAKLLKFYREKANLTVYQVGELIGKSGKTVSAWENNRGQPDADIFLKLCDVYKVENVSVFFGQNTSSPRVAELYGDISPNEINHIKKYRALDERGKQTVDIVLNAQYELITSIKQSTAIYENSVSISRIADEELSFPPKNQLSREEMHQMLDQELNALEKGQTSSASMPTNGTNNKKMA